MESATGQHSERVIEPLWFYRSHADHTALANELKPVSNLIIVKNQKTRRAGAHVLLHHV